MIYILFYLLPSILGSKIIMKFNSSRKLKEIILDYLLLVLFSNLICMFIIVLVNKFDGNLMIYLSEHLAFAVKYLFMSIVINFVLAFIFSIFIKYVDIKLEVKCENKKSYKKHKKGN